MLVAAGSCSPVCSFTGCSPGTKLGATSSPPSPGLPLGGQALALNMVGGKQPHRAPWSREKDPGRRLQWPLGAIARRGGGPGQRLAGARLACRAGPPGASPQRPGCFPGIPWRQLHERLGQTGHCGESLGPWPLQPSPAQEASGFPRWGWRRGPSKARRPSRVPGTPGPARCWGLVLSHQVLPTAAQGPCGQRGRTACGGWGPGEGQGGPSTHTIC